MKYWKDQLGPLLHLFCLQPLGQKTVISLQFWQWQCQNLWLRDALCPCSSLGYFILFWDLAWFSSRVTFWSLFCVTVSSVVTSSNIWNLLISVIHNNHCTYSSLDYLQDLVHMECVTHLSQWWWVYPILPYLSMKHFLCPEIMLEFENTVIIQEKIQEFLVCWLVFLSVLTNSG